jgi:hypothetical protein
MCFCVGGLRGSVFEFNEVVGNIGFSKAAIRLLITWEDTVVLR